MNPCQPIALHRRKSQDARRNDRETPAAPIRSQPRGGPGHAACWKTGSKGAWGQAGEATTWPLYGRTAGEKECGPYSTFKIILTESHLRIPRSISAGCGGASYKRPKIA